MSQATSKLDAVRLARERLGDATAQELAAYVEASFELKLQPAIVSVLLASLREREALEHSRKKAQEEIERFRAEQPEAREKKPRRKKASAKEAKEHADPAPAQGGV